MYNGELMARTARSSAAAATETNQTTAPEEPRVHEKEVVEISRLRPHPRNYKRHPDDQLEHIAASLRTYGYYKDVVVARDYTILAGHGVIQAAREKLRATRAPVTRLDLAPEHPLALKLVALDNEVGRFGESDDRALSELLREIRSAEGVGLLGTGYDDSMLAALVMVTRPASEIRDVNAAAEWVGMPEYDAGEPQIKLVVSFRTEADRDKFVGEAKLKIDKVAGLTWSTRWPFTEREDVAGVKFEAAESAGATAATPAWSVLDEKPREALRNFLRRCSAAGVADLPALERVCEETVRHLKGGDEARAGTGAGQDLENRWYASLERGAPDFKVYDEDAYLGELWGCWLVYSRAYLRNLRAAAPVLEQLGEVRTVADLGCGFGYTTAALRQVFPDARSVCGTNLDGTTQMRILSRVAAEYGFDVATEVRAAQEKRRHDLVFASEYFEHVSAPVEHLREVLDALRPRALLVANSFGTRGLGHFLEYEDEGSTISPEEARERFDATLRKRGYEKVKTGFWNNRPTLWLSVKK